MWENHKVQIPPYFDVDIDSCISQHDVQFLSLPDKWQDGIFLGNGDMTANLFFPPGKICFGIGKVDIWDLRFPRDKFPFHKHEEYLKAYNKKDFNALIRFCADENAYLQSDIIPQPKPAGFLELSEVNKPAENFQGRLSLINASADIFSKNKKAEKQVSALTSFMHSNKNVFLIQLDRRIWGNEPIKLTLNGDEIPADEKTVAYIGGLPKGIKEHWQKAEKCGWAKPSCDGNRRIWIERKLLSGFKWIIMAESSESLTSIEFQDREAIISISPSSCPIITLFLTVVTSNETKDILKSANANLDWAVKRKYAHLKKEHFCHWKDFWQKSLLSISDKMVENLWYLSLYFLSSCSRGLYPPSIQSPWHLAGFQGWSGDYHTNLNIEFLYYLPLISNHLELGMPFLTHFRRILPLVKKETKKQFQMPGAKYPFSSVPSGKEIASGHWRYEPYSSAWLAEVFWRYYEYSQDKKFLKEVAYPVIREVAIFYEHYFQKDENRHYSLYPLHNPEFYYTPENYNPVNFPPQPLWVKNTAIDLAFAKMLLKISIEAGKLLRKDNTRRKKWQEIVDNMAPYPKSGTGEMLPYEGGAPDAPVCQNVALKGHVFPCGEIGLGSDIDELENAKRLFAQQYARRYTKAPRKNFPFDKVPAFASDICQVYLATVAARLGLGESARAYLCDILILQMLKENGILGHTFWGPIPPAERKIGTWLLNTSTGFGVAVNEMMLQSYNKIIYLFPAIPKDWDCLFINFRAVGGFLVSAVKKKEIIFATIHSTVGGKCTISNPWEKNPKITNSKGQSIDYVLEDALITFRTVSKELYFIRPENMQIPHIVLKGEKKNPPRIYMGPKYMQEVPKNEQWRIHLGKLQKKPNT